MEIRTLRQGDGPEWRRLWAGYTRFYETTVPDDVTETTWRRLMDPVSPLIGRVAEQDGHLFGFSTSVIHESTWTTAPSCYLEDLFVDPNARGRGVGSALMQDIIDLGRKEKWSRVYWHTRAGNVAARRLYDQLVKADDFVRYRLPLG